MKTTFQNKQINLPDFLLVGAAKSGTTSLYNYLNKNEKIFLSKEKEPHFFSFYNTPPNFNSPETLPTTITDIHTYTNLFKSAKQNQILGEASQSYLFLYKKVISNIKKIYGDKHKEIKIIIILRNPIERAWSQYWHFKKNFNEDLDFQTAISPTTLRQREKDNWNIFYNYIDFGFYTHQIKAYLESFNNVKIFLYEDLKNNPNELMKELSHFLKIDYNFIETNRKYNPSGEPKNNLYGKMWKLNAGSNHLKKLKKIIPLKLRKTISNHILENALTKKEMDSQTKNQLTKLYHDEINQLYHLLKRNEIKQWLK